MEQLVDYIPYLLASSELLQDARATTAVTAATASVNAGPKHFVRYELPSTPIPIDKTKIA